LKNATVEKADKVAECKSERVKEGWDIKERKIKKVGDCEAGQPERGARRFEELGLWQQARELAKEIYDDFLRGRDRGISVISNIAEGFERPTGEDGLNYLCAGYKGYFTRIDLPMKILAGLLLAGAP
jgi:hypothetical protein